MSARDELVHRVLWGMKIPIRARDYVTLDANAAHAIADAIITAGYRKPRPVTTVEELDALPVGSIVRGDKFGVSIKEDTISRKPWASDGSKFAESAADVLHRLGKPEVIHEPKD